jgi:hypothetical protein
MNQKQLFTAAALAALRLAFSLAGATIPGLLGIPGTSGVINILWAGGFLVLPALLIRRFGASTVAGTIYGLLALPLPLSGPPGFLPKVIIGLTTGLIVDLIFKCDRKRERLLSITSGSLAQILLGIELALIGLALRIPGMDKYAALQFSLPVMIASAIGGALSGYLGWLAYQRIRESGAARRIAGDGQQA